MSPRDVEELLVEEPARTDEPEPLRNILARLALLDLAALAALLPEEDDLR